MRNTGHRARNSSRKTRDKRGPLERPSRTPSQQISDHKQVQERSRRPGTTGLGGGGRCWLSVLRNKDLRTEREEGREHFGAAGQAADVFVCPQVPPGGEPRQAEGRAGWHLGLELTWGNRDNAACGAVLTRGQAEIGGACGGTRVHLGIPSPP